MGEALSHTYSGACHCKNITFEVAGAIQYVVFCHCHQCQKIHSAPFAAWVGFYTKNYTITGDLTFYKTKYSERGFCPICSSCITFRYHNRDWPNYEENEIAFARSCFDTDIVYDGAEHIFINKQANWFHFQDDLPKIECGEAD